MLIGTLKVDDGRIYWLMPDGSHRCVTDQDAGLINDYIAVIGDLAYSNGARAGEKYAYSATSCAQCGHFPDSRHLKEFRQCIERTSENAMRLRTEILARIATVSKREGV